MGDEDDARLLDRGAALGELVGRPDVVLVAVGDERARAEGEGAVEVIEYPELGRVRVDANGEWGPAGEGFEQGDRAVGRDVVADDELGGEACLAGDAIELGLEVGLAVIGRQGDGDAAPQGVGDEDRGMDMEPDLPVIKNIIYLNML